MLKRSRRSARIPGYDYSKPGAYFVTINVKGHYCFFGNIVNGMMHLSEAGKMINQIWREIPFRYENTVIDEYVIMPNHVHGIIRILDAVSGMDAINGEAGMDAINRVHTGGATENKNPMLNRGSLSNIIRWFKGRSAFEIRKMPEGTGFAWHSRFYEHIIRGERQLARIRNYIKNNPARWESGRNYKE